jgi:glycosyltransferase involved in cell wall biosynthesis
MIVKFAPWSHEIYHKSEHPEYVAIRNIVSQNRQHTFTLVGKGGTRYEHFGEKGISFYNIRSKTKFEFLFSFFLEFELAFLSKPRIIVAAGVTSILPVGIASILTRARLIPLLTGEIGYDLLQYPKPLRKMLAFFLKAALRKAYAVLAISESVKKETVNNCGINSNKVFVYKYKISGIFNPHVPRDLKLFLNHNGPIVLAVARMSPEKGLIYLVEAARIVVNSIPNVKFVIKTFLPGNNYEGKVRNLIHRYSLQKYFVFLGESPYSEMPKYMAVADVFVLPSISEGLGLVILEALATGVPVVASKVGGIPDILIHEYNGLLVEPRDIEGLAEAIVRILSDDKLKRRLIEGGLAAVRCTRENEIEKLLSRLIFEN